MKLIIHIGPHKTGSSYLQRELFNNAGTLSATGVVYPINEWIKGGFGHAGLIDFNRIREVGTFLRSLIASNPSTKTVVLSSENFDRLSVEQVQELACDIKFDVEVIYYARRFDKTLYANWQEDVKFGLTNSLSYYLLLHISRPFRSKIINHCTVLDIWSACFGKDSIKIVDYDDLIEKNVDIYKHFEESILSIQSSYVHGQGFSKENISLDVAHAEILRHMHIMMKTRENDSYERVTYTFYQLLDKKNELLKILKDLIDRNLKVVELDDHSILGAVHENFINKYSTCLINGNGRFRLDSMNIVDDDFSLVSDLSSLLVEFKKLFF